MKWPLCILVVYLTVPIPTDSRWYDCNEEQTSGDDSRTGGELSHCITRESGDKLVYWSFSQTDNKVIWVILCLIYVCVGKNSS